MRGMNTIREFFDLFGGPSKVAEALGVGHSTASEMKRRSSIPVIYWPKLIESERGKELAISPADLLRFHTEQRDGDAA